MAYCLHAVPFLHKPFFFFFFRTARIDPLHMSENEFLWAHFNWKEEKAPNTNKSVYKTVVCYF